LQTELKEEQYCFVVTWGWDKQQNAAIWQKAKDHVEVGGGWWGSSQDGKYVQKLKIIFLQFPSFILSVLLLANTSQHIFLVDLSCVDV